MRTWKSGKQTIRIEFCYCQRSCRETLQLSPPASNIEKVKQLRIKIIEVSALGTFNYAEFFPFSNMAMKLGHVPSRILVRELLDRFLAQMKNKVEYTTYDRYNRVCQKHLYPSFGELSIVELNAGRIWYWLKSLHGTQKIVTNILIPLRAIIDEALIYGYLVKNPFDLINLARLKNPKSNYSVNLFNKKEIQKLLMVAEGQIKNVLQVVFFTGLRTSELIGLHWNDVNWEHATLEVKRAFVAGIEKCTKTKSSVRTIYLLPSALSALEALRQYTLFYSKYIFHDPFKNRH